MDEILNMRPWLFITLLVSFSFVVWVYYSFFFRLTVLFVWLRCGTRHAFPFPFCFCAVTAEAKYIFCTHNSLICKTLICKTIISPTTLYSHMYATYVRSSYAKLSRSIGHSLWFDYQMPLYLFVPNL